MIVFKQVEKTFPNGDTILKDLEFKVEPEEFVIFQGPSGSGKTTLLRLIYKDLEPTSGTIKIDGEKIADLSPQQIRNLRHKIGFAFQDFRIIEDKTVQENIALSLEILGLDDQTIEKRVNHLLDLVGLASKKLLFPVQLSGGELQRASLARAMATEPEILLADEPTGNLDPHTARQIVDLLKQINKLGTTVILATHDQPIIEYLKVRQVKIPRINQVDQDDQDESESEEKTLEKRTKKSTPPTKKKAKKPSSKKSKKTKKKEKKKKKSTENKNKNKKEDK